MASKLCTRFNIWYVSMTLKTVPSLLKHCLEGFENFLLPGLTIVDQALIQVYFNRYNILITLFTYVLPLIVITLTTIHMSHVLWGRPPPGEINQQLQLSIKKKKKVRSFYHFSQCVKRILNKIANPFNENFAG